LKIKIYKTVVLHVALYGCETWSVTLKEEHSLRTGCWGEHLDLTGRKWREAGEDCIMSSFMTCTLRRLLLLLLEYSNQG